jgi:alkylated DNA repair dioxygenase AlkB
MKSQPLTQNLKSLTNSINEKFNSNFNGILINEYIDGSNKIGAHSDNMKLLDPNVGVVSVSYGGTRHFVVRDKSTKKVVAKACANSGSIIHMNGSNFQKKFTHEIPGTTKHVPPRYSFTFRCHDE